MKDVRSGIAEQITVQLECKTSVPLVVGLSGGGPVKC